MIKIKVAIVGYGNVGKYALEAVEAAVDMELVGIVRQNPTNNPVELNQYKVVKNIDELGKVDVAILCSPTRSIPTIAAELLAKGINTVDSFDVHKEIWDLKKTLEAVAIKNKSKAIIAAGWDPGTDSVVRALLLAMAPKGITYTNFGPGMSMGHTVVAKSKKGIKDALSMTMPMGDGIHRRIIYLEMEQGADFDTACKEVKADSYFINDECKFIQVKDVKDVINVAHGTNIIRKGVSGKTHNQSFQFQMTINNPALTSQVLVSCARATMKMEAGCYTLIEVPMIKLLAGDEETLIKELV